MKLYNVTYTYTIGFEIEANSKKEALDEAFEEVSSMTDHEFCMLVDCVDEKVEILEDYGSKSVKSKCASKAKSKTQTKKKPASQSTRRR